jgi:TolA-binding protein
MSRIRLVVVASSLLLWASPTYAQGRELLQITADLRILQEHVARLQLGVNRLDERVEATTTRVEAVSAASLKGFADQQLLTNQIVSALALIREQLDDNSTRVSSLGQEFAAIYEGLRLLTDQVNRLAAAASGPADTSAAGMSPLNPVILPPSAGRLFTAARGDYLGGRYELAIEGFRELVKAYPTSPDAAMAQFSIGEAFYFLKDCKSAIVEYEKFVADYPTSERRPEGLNMIGVCYTELGQSASAQRAFDLSRDARRTSAKQ